MKRLMILLCSVSLLNAMPPCSVEFWAKKDTTIRGFFRRNGKNNIERWAEEVRQRYVSEQRAISIDTSRSEEERLLAKRNADYMSKVLPPVHGILEFPGWVVETKY